MDIDDINSERLFIRRMEAADAVDLLPLYSDKATIWGQSINGPIDTADDMLAYIRAELAQCKHSNLWPPMVIERKADARIIGVLLINAMVHNSVDIAYFLIPSARHQGYMKEALSAYCRCLFEQGRINQIQVQYRRDNIASARLAAACGFVKSAKAERILLNDGRFHETDTCILHASALTQFDQAQKKDCRYD